MFSRVSPRGSERTPNFRLPGYYQDAFRVRRLSQTDRHADRVTPATKPTRCLPQMHAQLSAADSAVWQMERV